MKSGMRLIAGVTTAVILAGVEGRTDVVIKDNNTNNLNLGSSWVGGTPPGASDTAAWNSTVTGANTVLLGADMSLYGILVASPGGLVTINFGNTLTLGAGGSDLSAATQNLTLNVTTSAGASEVWNVASGRLITLHGNSPVFNFGSAYGLTIDGGGTIHIGQANLSNVATLTIENGLLKTGNRAQ